MWYNADTRVKSVEDPVLAQRVFHIFDPPKHEEVAIFLWKISGFRMFVGL
jgi:hypothetical protein